MVDLQPVLSNEIVTLTPLEESDYAALYSAASDPDIWIQHPNPERYREEVFQTFSDTLSNQVVLLPYRIMPMESSLEAPASII